MFANNLARPAKRGALFAPFFFWFGGYFSAKMRFWGESPKAKEFFLSLL